jgi:hypothetical protein
MTDSTDEWCGAHRTWSFSDKRADPVCFYSFGSSLAHPGKGAMSGI